MTCFIWTLASLLDHVCLPKYSEQLPSDWLFRCMEVAGECISNAGDFNMAISATHLSLKAEKLHPPDIQACLWDAMSLKKVASKGKELKCLISERCG